MHKILYFSSKSLAVVLHPLLMPSYIYSILVSFSAGIMGNFNPSQKIAFVVLMFVSTFVLPLLIVILQMLATDENFSFSSLFIENARDRVRPFLLVSIVYSALSYYVYTSWPGQLIIAALLAMIALSIFITAVISRYWKISAHGVGIGGVAGVCLLFNIHYLQSSLFVVMLVSVGVAGLLLSSRLYLGAHTPRQVYAGWLLGTLVGYCSIILL